MNFLKVIMARGISHGRVRTTTMATTATESCKMAAIIQTEYFDRDMQPWFTVYVSYIGHPCYDQLTPVK